MYLFNNGCVFEGDIRDNEANGVGSYLVPYENYEYQGEWADDVPHGKGR